MSSDSITNCATKIDPELYSCRVCLDTKYSNGINLDESSHILKLLEYCVGFTIDIQYTSHVLCVKCKKKIEEFEEFKRQCEKTERHWKKFPIVNCPKYYEVNHHNDILSILIKQEKTDTEQECEELKSEVRSEKDFDHSVFEGDSSHEIINDSSTVNNNVTETCSNQTEDDNHFIVRCEDNIKTYYECEKCKRKYSRRKWLQKHLAKRRCKFNVENNKHWPNVKPDDKNIKSSTTNECGLCDTPFSCDLSEHIMKHHWLNNNLQCGLCNYCGKDFAHMITHRYTHCSKVRLHCVACDRKHFSMLSLQFHFRSAHLKKPGGYCTFCDKTFHKFKTWKTHHRMHTESNKLYVCDHCGKKFLYRHEMKTHLNYHHSDLRQYVCETCGKGFKRISALREHLYNIHEKREPVTCGHCNKVYKCENKLKLHLRNIALEKQFVCDVCSKKFYTETILRKHMFWHTNERPFCCEVCGAKYKAKAELKVHMRKHSGDMPYVCVTCGKRFPSSGGLKVHSSVHTGVRAHKCTQCERSFHFRKQMLAHAAQHRNVDGVKLET